MELKIEVGKKYKLRNGSVARCICTDRVDSTFAASHVFLHIGTDIYVTEQILYTSVTGAQYPGGRSSDFDLISEYREPRKLYLVYDSRGDRRAVYDYEENAQRVVEQHNSWTWKEFVEKMD